MTSLIVGLGNPGPEYKDTRHNIGFMVVDKLSESLSIKVNKKKFKGVYGEGFFNENKVILFKPNTYMNNSGDAVGEIVRFFNINFNDLIVAYDEIDLPLGNLKIKFGGGTAGHKGLNSIVNNLGNKDFIRLRVGISKPLDKDKIVKHVLSKFAKKEKELIGISIENAKDAVMEILTSGIKSSMNKFN